MDFNDRVLQLVENPELPLLERLKFCAIYESNLDEFFMVRVAGQHEKIAAGIEGRGADGMSAAEQITAVREKVLAQRERLEACLEGELRPALDEHGIRIISYEETSPDDRRELDALFETQVFPALTPLVLGMGRPFPYISNLSLSLLVVLRDPEQEGDILARVKVPKELLRRYVPLPDGNSFVAMEEVIARNLEALFPGMEIIGHALFRVTRDTDYDVSDEADDVRQAVEDQIRRRRFGEVIRLELSGKLDPRLRERLVSLLNITEEQVYEFGGMLGLDDLWDVVGVSGFSDLRDKPFSGVTQSRLQGEDGQPADILGAMREGDILVHHPYDAFSTSVEAFVKQADERPGRRRDQADRVPDERRFAARPLADRRRRARQAGGLHGGAQGALRRAGEHHLGEAARAVRRPRRLRDPGAEDARQVRARRPPRGRRRPPLRPHRDRQLQRRRRPASTPTSGSSPPTPTSAPTSPRCSTT